MIKGFQIIKLVFHMDNQKILHVGNTTYYPNFPESKNKTICHTRKHKKIVDMKYAMEHMGFMCEKCASEIGRWYLLHELKDECDCNVN